MDEGGYGDFGMYRWLIYYGFHAKALQLVGRLVSEALLNMDQPNVSAAFRQVQIHMRGGRF